MNYKILHGDVIAMLKTLPDNSVDAVVNDPPYHLTTGKKGGTGEASVNLESPYGRARVTTGFMGMTWDGGEIAYSVEMWSECLRVLKPGGHLLSFGGSRTYHRMACAVEDAGFEVRDEISYFYSSDVDRNSFLDSLSPEQQEMFLEAFGRPSTLSWTFGSGFPKSMDVSKAIDKAAGAEREVVGISPYSANRSPIAGSGKTIHREGGSLDAEVERLLTTPTTDDARQWDGWGTALKPAHEPIVLARKPLIGTVVANVLQYGTGALNIAACRIPGEPVPINKLEAWSGFGQEVRPEYEATMSDVGRWPANLIHDGSEEVLEEFAKYGDKSSARANGNPNEPKRGGNSTPLWGFSDGRETHDFRDSGTAARFFYCAKASREDRNEGCEELELKPLAYGNQAQAEVKRGNNEHSGNSGMNTVKMRGNNHPTVKPTDLMRYLCKMITPPGGTVLDCFMGSGSTGKAALMEGFNFIGIDKDENYCAISKARMEHVLATDVPLLRAIEVAEREAEIEPQITQETFNF